MYDIPDVEEQSRSADVVFISLVIFTVTVLHG